MQHGPAVRRRKLGAELRALRTSAGLTSGEAARLVDWHQSKVSRIETGTSGVKPADVRLLLDAYAVADTQLRELLMVLAGPEDSGGRHHWWHAYRGVLPPTYRDFISLESQAGAMRTLETTVVPGLLQTPEYARAVTKAAVEGLSEDRLDTLVEVRLARQDVLRADPPLELSPGRGGAAQGGGRAGGHGPAAGAAGRGGAAAPSAAPGPAVRRRGAHRRHGPFRYLLIFEHF
jgi:transcriptional regulator with XRE-family HTH domain